jgi:hypothetical protein
MQKQDTSRWIPRFAFIAFHSKKVVEKTSQAEKSERVCSPPTFIIRTSGLSISRNISDLIQNKDKLQCISKKHHYAQPRFDIVAQCLSNAHSRDSIGYMSVPVPPF